MHGIAGQDQAERSSAVHGRRRVGLDGRKQQLGLPGAAEGAGVWGLRLGCTGTSGSWGSSIYARFAVCHMRALAQSGLRHRSGLGWSGVHIPGSSMIWRMSCSSADAMVPCLVCLARLALWLVVWWWETRPRVPCVRWLCCSSAVRCPCGRFVRLALPFVHGPMPLWAVLKRP